MKIEFNPQKIFHSSKMAAVTSCEHTLYLTKFICHTSYHFFEGLFVMENIMIFCLFTEKSFSGIVPHKQKIKSGEAVLRFYPSFFSLTKKDSHRLIGHWKFTSLPKYGAVEGGFAFQAVPDNPNGDKSLVFFFATRSGKEIHALFDSVCRAGEVGIRQDSHSGTSSIILFALIFLLTHNCLKRKQNFRYVKRVD